MEGGGGRRKKKMPVMMNSRGATCVARVKRMSSRYDACCRGRHVLPGYSTWDVCRWGTTCRRSTTGVTGVWDMCRWGTTCRRGTTCFTGLGRLLPSNDACCRSMTHVPIDIKQRQTDKVAKIASYTYSPKVEYIE